MPDTQQCLPEDDSAVYEGRRLVLNRIDQEYGCDKVITYNNYFNGSEYCGLPEHDPFTNRCRDHTNH